LEGFARVAAARGEVTRALALAAAAERYRETIDVPLSQRERAELSDRLAPAYAALTPEAREAAWTAGRQLPLEEATALTAVVAPAAPVPSPIGAVAVLSAREAEVLRLIAAGKRNPEIAAEIVLSVHTVIRHANHIFAKLGVQNRVEAATYAQRHGLA
jgi:DNA-binding NarL/FixJ family response regulator